MANTVRQRIVNTIAARMAYITTANDFQTDIGEKVTIWNLKPITERNARGVDVSDPEDKCEPSISNGGEDHTLTVRLEVHARDGDATDEYMRKAVADVYFAIGFDRYWREDTTISAGPAATVSNSAGLARNGSWPSVDRIALEQGGVKVGGAQIVILVKYRTGTLDPYTLK